MALTLGEFLKDEIGRLKAAGVPSARLDCLILLEDTLKRDRAYILAHPEHPLTQAHVRTLHKQIIEREQHMQPT